MSLQQILTQPILQEIIPHFDPKDWGSWNRVCKKTNRLSKAFYAQMTIVWAKRCPHLLPTGIFESDIPAYRNIRTFSSIPYIETTDNKRLYIGEGQLRCGCSQHGKVGIRNSLIHGSVLDCEVHTTRNVEFHGHYINGVPTLAFRYKNRRLSKQIYATDSSGELTIQSDQSINVDIPQITKKMWKQFDHTITDPKKCEICQHLHNMFPGS